MCWCPVTDLFGINFDSVAVSHVNSSEDFCDDLGVKSLSKGVKSAAATLAATILNTHKLCYTPPSTLRQARSKMSNNNCYLI